MSKSGIGLVMENGATLNVIPNVKGSFNYANRGSWNIQQTYPEGAVFGVSVTTPLGTLDGQFEGFTLKYSSKL